MIVNLIQTQITRVLFLFIISQFPGPGNSFYIRCFPLIYCLFILLCCFFVSLTWFGRFDLMAESGGFIHCLKWIHQVIHGQFGSNFPTLYKTIYINIIAYCSSLGETFLGLVFTPGKPQQTHIEMAIIKSAPVLGSTLDKW